MALNVFKGIEQVTEATYLGLTNPDKIGKLYLVKRTDGYGDIYFGTRHYGHFSQTEIDKLAQAVKDIDANKTAIDKNTSDITQQRTDFDKLVSLVDSMVKYEYKETANVPEGVTPVSKDEVPSTVGKTDPEYITVNGKNYHKEVVSTSEVLDSLKKMINDVDAKFESYKVKTVVEGDKVLSVSDQGVLSSTMSLKYDSTKKRITLYGGSEDDAHKIGEVNTTDFIKDGMLETAELVTVRTEGDKLVYGEGEGTQVPESVTEPGKYIRLHFNTDSSANDIFLSVNDLVDVYKGGKDIAVKEDNTIDVALDEDITVAGLSDTYGCGLIKNGNTIKAGTSLSEVLKMMLSKELNPAPSTKPSISIAKASAASGLHEIGEIINVGTASISKTAGKFNNNGWTSPAQPTPTFEWSNEKMSSTITSGATGYAAQTNVATIGQGTATTEKGSNKITISASADYSAPTNKPTTNLKNEYDGTEATWVAGTASNAATIDWTGVYPCFTNIDGLGNDPGKRVTLQTSKTFHFTVGVHNTGGDDFRFAYPDGWTISSFKVKSLDGKYYEYAASYNKNAGTIEKTIQNNPVTYHYLTVSNGAADYEIVLDKNLDA